jgi:hypothetical protein
MNMGYYATGGGLITFKKDADRKAVKKIIKENCPCEYDILDSQDDFSVSVCQYDKYYEDDYYDFLKEIAPFTEDGNVEFIGEDSQIWRFFFSNGRFEEEGAEIVWPYERQAKEAEKEQVERYILCSVLDRDFYNKQFSDFGEAKAEMLKEFKEELFACGVDVNRLDFSAEEYDNESDDYPMGWNKYGAYCYSPGGENDWYIVPVK